MTKKEKLYVGGLVGLFVLMIILEMAQPRPVNWRHTYHKNDKIPYGNYLLYSLIDEARGEDGIYEITDSYFEEKGYFSEQDKHLLFIGDSYSPDKLDLDILMKYVAGGAHAFLVANNFPVALKDTLGFDTHTDYFFEPLGEQDDAEKETKNGKVPINFTNRNLQKSNGFAFKRNSVTFYFKEQEEKPPLRILTNNHNNKPIFITVPFGKGYFFLHCNPLIFTNFQMLTEDGSDYISSALAYIPQSGSILWDTYQQGIKTTPQTPIRFILQQKPLKWAWYLGLALLILWMLFQAKRRQRKIPVFTPPPNTSLELVETIAQLHFQQKQHHQLAKKKIKFLNEGLKKKYFVRTNDNTAEKVDKICRMSKLKKEDVLKMLEFMTVLEIKQPISELELQQLENYAYKLTTA